MGPTLEQTEAVGGYGYPTAKHYDLDVRYVMPFGSMGQSARKYESQTLDRACKPRYTIFTVIPNSWNSVAGLPEDLNLQWVIRAYPWNQLKNITAPA